jgi:hypothetical protein
MQKRFMNEEINESKIEQKWEPGTFAEGER